MFQFSLKQLMLVVTVIGTLLAFAIAWKLEGIIAAMVMFATLSWGRRSWVAGILFGGLSGLMLSTFLARWWHHGSSTEPLDFESVIGLPWWTMNCGGLFGAIAGGLYARRCIRRDNATDQADP